MSNNTTEFQPSKYHEKDLICWEYIGIFDVEVSTTIKFADSSSKYVRPEIVDKKVHMK